ncbi:MAG: MFS transporter [Oceanibaculum nanhaiense]|uniref:MFS transporter n=1 Tax=Oceanibaculum nanhaiense TaxID=1909734 RepID=UPI0025A317D9|nr:MFS transporter [Oceanibaculum nanhaiense]MDM7947516.1 MFS transporter [Oceanibaculum nanhaiense]
MTQDTLPAPAPTPVPALTERARRLAMVALLSVSLGAGLMIGITMPLLSMLLELRGTDTLLIGLNAAMSTFAILLTGPFLPLAIRRFGTLPVMYLSIVFGIAVLLAMPVFTSLPAWFVLRFALGISVGIAWIASEAWLNAIVTDRNRGKMLGLYVTCFAGGFALGPVIVGTVGLQGPVPFLIAAAILGASALPLPLARHALPPVPSHAAGNILRLMLLAPTIMLAAAISGLSDATVFALLPVYALRVGFAPETAVLLLSTFLAGNLALQVPLGWLADRVNRRLLLAICGAAGVLGPAAVAAALGTWLVWPLLFAWGGVVMGVYTIGLCMLAERFDTATLSGANAAFVMLYSLGSMSGPVLGSAAMTLWDPHGMLAFGAAASLLFLLIVMARAWFRARKVRTG